MEIRYTYVWKWGDKSSILYNTTDGPYAQPSGLAHLASVIDKAQARTEADIYEHTWELVYEMPPMALRALITNDTEKLSDSHLSTAIRQVNDAIAELQTIRQQIANIAARALEGEKI